MGDTLDRFLAFAAPNSLAAMQKYNDQQTMRNDLVQFQADPTYRADPSKYANPETGIAVDTHLKGLRDFKLQEQANPVLDKFAADYSALAGPDKRFYSDPASREVLMQNGLQEPSAGGNSYIRKGLADFAKQGQLESDLADQFANPGDNNVLARIAANPLAQANHNVIGTMQGSQDKALTRTEAAAKEERATQARQNVSDFQGAIAGLTGPAQSPSGIAQFAKRGGYDTFPGVESDIRQAAASYNVGDSPEVNKAVTDARTLYKDTMLPTESGTIGRTSYTGQQNLLGDFKKDVTSTAPVINVKVGVPTPSETDSLVQAVLAGQIAPKNLPKRTGAYSTIMAKVLQQNPTFDAVKADANAAYAQAPGNLQSRALIQGVEPLYDNLLTAGKALGNSSIPGVNKVKNWFNEATGQPEIVAFNNLRDDTIAESERVLLGSGVLSDSKYLRAVKNVSSAASMPQLNAAVRQLRLTVKSRLEALDKQPFQTSGSTAPAPAADGPQKIGKYSVVVH